MRLTREEFQKAVDIYEQMTQEEAKITDSLNIDLDWVPSTWIEHYYNLLSMLCDFSEEEYTLEYGTDLDYYCYDLAFGKKWTPGIIKVDGKDMPCRNSGDVYDLITYLRN